jgi:hypothetical protein
VHAKDILIARGELDDGENCIELWIGVPFVCKGWTSEKCIAWRPAGKDQNPQTMSLLSCVILENLIGCWTS